MMEIILELFLKVVLGYLPKGEYTFRKFGLS